jgi:hypothetical protein
MGMTDITSTRCELLRHEVRECSLYFDEGMLGNVEVDVGLDSFVQGPSCGPSYCQGFIRCQISSPTSQIVETVHCYAEINNVKIH